MNKIITEITPLSEKDCFYLVDRYKDRFTFPVHRHEEYELNFLANCTGARRVVGDSMETIGEYDLVLIGNGIEHGWEQHECDNNRIREITIQFSHDLFGESLLEKTQLASVRRMLEVSSNGIVFSSGSIMKVFNRLDNLTKIDSGFYGMIELMAILYELAEEGNYRRLSSSSFASLKPTVDSRRVQKVQDYINLRYKEDIRLSDLAALVGMTPTAFSRFFKLRTGRSISDYIIGIRLDVASRDLVSTRTPIADICFSSGFNNVSNFNRIFKKNKGCTPKEFREVYKRNKFLV